MAGGMIIGTAGHVDHGKSALVTALTGRSMDRLAEERRRGITIELGFAPLDLGDGRVAGVVDVPGHEDFIRTMVAGASGIDVALLVVAADEGMMPQTEEHLLILEQLGIARGIPVVTKLDLVEPDWLGLVVADLEERLARSSVAFGGAVATSVRTGQGIDALRGRVMEELARAPQPPRDDLFRLPVDRAFSLSGVGTVVTGTSRSGAVEIGAELRLYPADRAARVRTVESFGRPASAATAGTRIAVGLAGIDRDSVARGTVAVSAGGPWEPSRVVDVVARLAAAAPRGLSKRSRVRVHFGTDEVMGWVTPEVPVAPGGSSLARLRLDRAIVARGGDRFVLRDATPVATIGGGTVVDPIPPAGRAAWPPALASADPAERLRALVERRPIGAGLSLLPVLLGVPAKEADRLVRADHALRRLGDIVVTEASVADAGVRASAAVAGYHRRQPAERGIPLETLRASAAPSPAVAEAALGDLVAGGSLVVADGLARERAFRPHVAGGDLIVARAVAEVERAGLSPPSTAELAIAIGRPDAAAVLRVAAVDGRVIAVERDRYFSRTAVEHFIAALRHAGASGDITVAALRDRLGLSRKYLIPLLEWSDAAGITVRHGDTRRLRPESPGAA